MAQRYDSRDEVTEREFKAGGVRPRNIIGITPQGTDEALGVVAEVDLDAIPGLKRAIAAHYASLRTGGEGLDVHTQWAVFPGDQKPRDPAWVALTIVIDRPSVSFRLLFDISVDRDQRAVLATCKIGGIALATQAEIAGMQTGEFNPATMFSVPTFDDHIASYACMLCSFDRLNRPQQLALLKNDPRPRAERTTIHPADLESFTKGAFTVGRVSVASASDGSKLYALEVDETQDDGLGQFFMWRKAFPGLDELSADMYEAKGTWALLDHQQAPLVRLDVEFFHPRKMSRRWLISDEIDSRWVEGVARGGTVVLAPKGLLSEGATADLDTERVLPISVGQPEALRPLVGRSKPPQRSAAAGRSRPRKRRKKR